MTLFLGDNLECTLGQYIIFKKLSFAVASGEILIIRGPNGSGKSSLIRIIAGLLKPTNGSIKWENIWTSREREKYKLRFHYVGHQEAIKPSLTVLENLTFWANIYGGKQDLNSRVDHALRAFNISDIINIPVSYLSAGERRRTAISRILTCSAKVWLLDEPTATLDKNSIISLRNVINSHCSRGGIVVMSTHTPSIDKNARVIDMAQFH